MMVIVTLFYSDELIMIASAIAVLLALARGNNRRSIIRSRAICLGCIGCLVSVHIVALGRRTLLEEDLLAEVRD